ncbi:MAG TPA: HD domain-containing protein [Candidatus Limnocylindrales bacterium]
MPDAPSLPSKIADIEVPRDRVSTATWRWAHRQLPDYLLTHSVRAYCWGAAIASREGWDFDRRVLWNASLMHDFGLTRIPRNTMCFEVEGAEISRRFLERHGMAADDAERVAIAIILHMQPSVTPADGVEAVLLDRATALDVRGDGYALVDDVRPGVMRAFPRRAFDRRFLAAIAREATIRPGCQSARLLYQTGLADRMARSPWPTESERSSGSQGGCMQLESRPDK